jgi:hypothetical protein
MVGKELKVTYNGNFVDGVEGFSITKKGGTWEITDATTGQDRVAKEFIGTLVEFSGSIKLKFVNFGDTNGQLALWNAVGAETPVEAVFYLDGGTKLTGDIIITNFPVDSNINDGAGGVSVDFQGSGTIVPAAA